MSPYKTISTLSLQLFCCVILCTQSLWAHAQLFKPGLWQITSSPHIANKSQLESYQSAQKKMSQMPPAQRKMFEEMMNKNGTSMLSVDKSGAVSFQMCITLEMVEKGYFPSQKNTHCTNQYSPKIGGGLKISYSCNNPVASGEGEIQMLTNTSYTMKMKSKIAENGHTVEQLSEAKANWLSDNCGKIRPVQ